MLFAFFLVLGLTSTSFGQRGALSIAPCPLAAFTDGQTVSVRGKVMYGPHDLLLDVQGCDNGVVLEYTNDGTSPSGEDLKRFKHYTNSTYKKVGKGTCIQCPMYEVTATLTGRLDVAAEKVPDGLWKDEMGWLHDASGKVVGQSGFGHPPANKYHLTVEAVTDIKARKLPKPKLPNNRPGGQFPS